MGSFFKTFGWGVVYVLLLPLIIAFFALYVVYNLLVFIYMAFRNVIVFFSGGSPFGDLKEDVAAKKILQQRFMASAPAATPTTTPLVAEVVDKETKQSFVQEEPEEETSSLTTALQDTIVEDSTVTSTEDIEETSELFDEEKEDR